MLTLFFLFFNHFFLQQVLVVNESDEFRLCDELVLSEGLIRMQGRKRYVRITHSPCSPFPLLPPTLLPFHPPITPLILLTTAITLTPVLIPSISTRIITPTRLLPGLFHPFPEHVLINLLALPQTPPQQTLIDDVVLADLLEVVEPVYFLLEFLDVADRFVVVLGEGGLGSGVRGWGGGGLEAGVLLAGLSVGGNVHTLRG